MQLPKTIRVWHWDITFRRPRWDLSNLTPPQLFIGSFLLLITLGTIGLKFLPGLYTGKPLNWLDSLFTATSAVCVTGLIVENTATYFTFAGQAYLLLLIQLGGLGMIAFTSMIIAALGRRLSLHHEAMSLAALETTAEFDRSRLFFDVVRFTFAFEIAGAVLLYFLWIPRLGWLDAVWPAVFHAVSAFCNAGFSTFADSLVPMRTSPLSLCVVMMLVVAGGMGFLTLEELYLKSRSKKDRRKIRLSLQSRIVLFTTAALLLGGWASFALLEWHNTLDGLGFFDKLVNSLFMSVTPRTAGFNNINYAQAREPTCFLTILLMIVGGSPGSTAGGIKTTTFAVLGFVAWSRLRAQRTTTVWNRSLRDETIDRTVGLVVVAMTVTVLGILLLSLSEFNPMSKARFLDRAFEAMSAFNTVGLSMGITPTLSTLGRWTAIALMFLGRVGPLTFASALAVRYAKASKFRYAYEDVVVG